MCEKRKEPLVRVTCHYDEGCMYPTSVCIPMNDGTVQRYVAEVDMKPLLFQEVMSNVERCKGYVSPAERKKK